ARTSAARDAPASVTVISSVGAAGARPSGCTGPHIWAVPFGRAGAMLSPWGQPRSTRACPLTCASGDDGPDSRADEEVESPHAAPPGRGACGGAGTSRPKAPADSPPAGQQRGP